MSRLPGFENIVPPKPTIRDEPVAEAFAKAVIQEINLDDFYWETEREVEDKVWEMKQAIVEGVPFPKLFSHLSRKHGGWRVENAEDHFDHIHKRFAARIEAEAVEAWRKRYEVSDSISQ